MTSAPIEGRGCTIHQLFNGHRYQLDYYQREYTWESENVRRLVEDLYRRFRTEWDVLTLRVGTPRSARELLLPDVAHLGKIRAVRRGTEQEGNHHREARG